jgi:hypothetical protein
MPAGRPGGQPPGRAVPARNPGGAADRDAVQPSPYARAFTAWQCLRGWAAYTVLNWSGWLCEFMTYLTS